MTPAKNESVDFLNDGETFTLGKTKLKLHAMPGHTPGNLGFEFTVYDNDKPYNAFLGGWTIGKTADAEKVYYEAVSRLEQLNDIQV